MATRVAGLTGATLPTAPSVCHDCIWWQARPGRSLSTFRTGSGRYQFQSPMIFMNDGTRIIRTTVASRNIAAASPTPNSCRPTKLPAMKPANAATMMIAAAVMIRPVCSRP